MDIAPTLLSLAGTAHPGNPYKGREVHQIKGKSLLPLLKGNPGKLHSSENYVGWELAGNRAIREGKWKPLWLRRPLGKGVWELFNLEANPAELHDLSQKEPEKLAYMTKLWEKYAEENSVIWAPSSATSRAS